MSRQRWVTEVCRFSFIVKHKHGVWCLEREEHERVKRGVFETEHGLQEREKERGIVRVGPVFCITLSIKAKFSDHEGRFR